MEERNANREKYSKLRKKAEPHFPTLNETALKKLDKCGELRSFGPFRFSAMKKVSREAVRGMCKEVLLDYKDGSLSRKNLDSMVHFLPYERVYVKKLVRELKRDHDLAQAVLQDLHDVRLFHDGTILDSESKNVMITEKAKSAPAKSRFIVHPSFKNKHLFAVIDGKLVPLVKFPKGF